MVGSCAVAKGETNAARLEGLQGALDLIVLQSLDTVAQQREYGIAA